MNLFDRIRDLKEKAARATPEPVDTIVKGDVNASGVQIWHMKGRPCFESQAKHDVEYYSICSPDLITELCTALEEARELIKQTNEHPDTWHIKTDQWLEKWGKE